MHAFTRYIAITHIVAIDKWPLQYIISRIYCTLHTCWWHIGHYHTLPLRHMPLHYAQLRIDNIAHYYHCHYRCMPHVLLYWPYTHCTLPHIITLAIAIITDTYMLHTDELLIDACVRYACIAYIHYVTYTLIFHFRTRPLTHCHFANIHTLPLAISHIQYHIATYTLHYWHIHWPFCHYIHYHIAHCHCTTLHCHWPRFRHSHTLHYRLRTLAIAI
jgi:hypothetical protein